MLHPNTKVGDRHTRLGPTALRILAALLSGEARTFRELLKLLGFRSTNTISGHVERLRRLGLVEWEEGRMATLRATCKFVPAEAL